MVHHETAMIGDSQLYVCSGERSCGALVKVDAWPFHVEHHLRLEGLAVSLEAAS